MSKESISRETFIKGVAAGAVVAASLGTLRFAEYSTADKAKKHSFVPGTYTSSAKGMESDVKVTITVDEKSITDASVDVSGETAGIGAAIGDEVSAQILDTQTPEIDGVAGATVSSQAVRDALTDAIARAEAGEADPETEAVTEAAAAEEAGATEAVTEGTAQQAAAGEEAGSAAGGYVPGTYSASAKGMESDVKVDITVDESSITDAAVDVSGETAGIGAEIADQVVSQILEAQSADIDGVAGATISSTAVREAAKAALAQAVAGAGDAASQEASAGEAEAVTEGTGEETPDEAVTEGTAQEAPAGTAGEEAAQQAASGEEAGDAAGGYKPGTYSASAKGMESDVSVNFTIGENGKIETAGVNVSGETPEMGAAIGAEVVKQLLAAQSADIDGVAGATVTSDAVRTAAADALSQAAAGTGESAAQEAPAEAAEAVTEGAAGAGDADAGAEGVSGGYVPGTYSASAKGMESDVRVSLTIGENGKITAAGVNVSGETPEMGAAIGPEIVKQLLAAQSTDIDGVAGATVTSDAVKAAAADALAQAAAGESGSAQAPAEEAEAVTEGAAQEAAEALTEAAMETAEETAEDEGIPADADAVITAATLAQYANVQTPVVPREQPEAEEESLTEAAEEAGEAITEAAVEAAEALTEAAMETAEETAEGEGIPADTDAVITAATLAQYANVQTPVVPREQPEAEEESLTEAAEEAAEAITESADEAAEALTDAAMEAAEDMAVEMAEGEGIPADADAVITADTLAQYAAPQTIVVPREQPEAEEESLTEAVEEAAEALTEAADEAVETLTEAADEAADEQAGSTGTYKEGTYRVTLPGLESDVTVVLTFDANNRITAVGINASGETPELGGAAATQLAGAILSAQSADVEAVAGATVTSEAIINAAKECLDQASE